MKLRSVEQITPDLVANASDYMPIAEKTKFVEYVSVRTLERLELRAETDVGESISVPPIYKENPELKRRYEMGAFVRFYLGLEAEQVDDDPYMLSRDDYDYAAKLHIFNQLERLKQQRESGVRDKIWDIMQDFRDLEKYLNNEVFGIVNAQNDILVRASNLIATRFGASALETAMQEFDAAKQELADYVAQKNA